MIKNSIVLLFLLSLNSFLYAQEKEPIIDEYDVFYDYTHWGLFINPILYESAEFSVNNVTKIKTANYIPSVQLGFKYHFNNAREFSFNTGLIFTWTPESNYSFTLNKENTYDNTEKYYEENGFSISNFLIPLNVEYKLQVAKNMFLNVNGGIAIGLVDGSFESTDYSIYPENQPSKEVFSFYNKTNDFYYGATVGSGLYIVLDKFMLCVNLLYNKNFNDVLTGEYSFYNLQTSPNEKGTFKFSGDYFGFSTTVYFKRKYNKQYN